MEMKYKAHGSITCPKEYRKIISELDNAVYKYLESHQILNLKTLSSEVNQFFKHNVAKQCKFSKCRTVFLTFNHPHSMVLSYFDSELGRLNQEAVLLVDADWPIAKLKTPEAFQGHYLSERGKTDEDINWLLPRLREVRFEPVLPKKLNPGEVYRLSAKKLDDLKALRVFLTAKGRQWANALLKRQGTENAIPKEK